MKLLNVATCNLNQWAMIYYCNMNNIKESISRAKEASAVIRRGPELEITGYGCEDHFLELDTVTHAWECLQELFLGDWTDGILCCFGMPVIKGSENFSCQLGSKKSILRTYCSQSKYLSLYRRQLCLSAMVIVSFWTRATHTCGEVYMYSNQQGCDGGRLYYDGRSCIFVNGNMVAQGSQFSMKDVELVVAQIDIDAVTSRRGSICSFQEQASCKQRVSSVVVPYKLCQSFNLQMSLSSPLKIQYQSPEEEIDFGPGCWLWDYLRRSGASGFLLPLSEIVNGDEQDKADAIRIGHYTDGQFPTDSKEFVKRVFYTVFMGSENRFSLSVLMPQKPGKGAGRQNWVMAS